MEYSTRVHETWNYASDAKTQYVANLDGLFYVADSKQELLDRLSLSEGEYEILDLTSDEVKFLIPMSDAFFHFFVESMAVVYKLIKDRSKEKLVIYIENRYKPKFTDDAEELLRKFLDKQNANYTIIRVSSKDKKYVPIIKVNHFVKIRCDDESLTCSLIDTSAAANDLVECSKELLGLDTKLSIPNKKVFITSSPYFKFDYVKKAEDGDLIGYQDDRRMYDTEKLEEFFSSLGYELVNTEEAFESLMHQIVFMSEVKTLAAVTCSGLANMLFMNPGQVVLEIQAEVVQQKPDALPVDKIQTAQRVHTVYSSITYIKDHFLISVPSHRDPVKVIEKLKGSKVMELL